MTTLRDSINSIPIGRTMNLPTMFQVKRLDETRFEAHPMGYSLNREVNSVDSLLAYMRGWTDCMNIRSQLAFLDG